MANAVQHELHRRQTLDFEEAFISVVIYEGPTVRLSHSQPVEVIDVA